MNEKQLETQILDWLNYQPNVFAFKVNTTGIFDPVRKVFRTIKNKHIHKGTADILGLTLGKFFAIEVKTKQTLRAAKINPKARDCSQDDFLRRVVSRGGYALKTSSLEDVVQFIFD